MVMSKYNSDVAPADASSKTALNDSIGLYYESKQFVETAIFENKYAMDDGALDVATHFDFMITFLNTIRESDAALNSLWSNENDNNQSFNTEIDFLFKQKRSNLPPTYSIPSIAPPILAVNLARPTISGIAPLEPIRPDRTLDRLTGLFWGIGICSGVAGGATVLATHALRTSAAILFSTSAATLVGGAGTNFIANQANNQVNRSVPSRRVPKR